MNPAGYEDIDYAMEKWVEVVSADGKISRPASWGQFGISVLLFIRK